MTNSTPSMNNPLRRCFTVLLISLVASTWAFPPAAKGVTPAPDGGYPNGNTAEGDNALSSLTTGSNNTAIGLAALSSNTTGFGNTATGWEALSYNSIGTSNTANGALALSNNVSGFNNTATGAGALYLLGDGSFNTATGAGAMSDAHAGQNNTATGCSALEYNTGDNNTAYGVNSLGGQTGGEMPGANNTAIGYAALAGNTTGGSNIAVGNQAGINLTTGNNNIDIGAHGAAGESNTIRIGRTGFQNDTYIAGIYGVTVASAVGVVIDAKGHLGTVTSSARFKEAIKPMDNASEAILALKPVTFRYKHELDPDGISQFGLVAEQVEKVNPDLVARDAEGKINTVRYEAVNAMLLNEFLKEHRKVQELEKDFRSTVAQQQKQIEALTAALQKVSNQVELSKPAAHVAANGK